MTIRAGICVLLLAAISTLHAEEAAKELSYRDLLDRLSNMEILAEPPVEGEMSGSFSSWHRSSRYDRKSDQYIKWHKNGDGSGFVRKEGDRFVIFEKEGPGVIWRIWSADPQKGHIRFIIDGQEVLNKPFKDLFETFGQFNLRMNFPDLVHTLSRGRNHWIPIPYNKSCKITMDPNWGRFYHITYTTFPKSTKLPVFTGKFERDVSVAIAEADKKLHERGAKRYLEKGETRVLKSVKVDPGKTVTVYKEKSPKAISGIVVRPPLVDRKQTEAMLRELTMQIYWDGEKKPSVWSPLGDFFGATKGMHNFRTLAVGMSEESMYSNWYMPFKSAKLTLTNTGKEARTVDFAILTKDLDRDPGELLRFHAKWHKAPFREEVQSKGRKLDWPMLVTEGTGRYCGVSIHVWNYWKMPERKPEYWWYGQWNRKTINWWWGEGDEKFYVDGEKMPSTFGTGSEDYVGYAWSAEAPFPTFQSAFASQPHVPVDSNGHTSINRFHTADNVPFQKSFTAVIEKYKTQVNECEMDYVAYFYLKPGQADRYEALPAKELKLQDPSR